MSAYKDFGIKGVADDVQFGKAGNKVRNQTGYLEVVDENNALQNIRAKTPSNASDVTTKDYVDRRVQYSHPTVIGYIYQIVSSPESVEFTSALQEGFIALCRQSVGSFTNKKLYRLETWVSTVANSTWTEITPADGTSIVTTVTGNPYLGDHIYIWDLGSTTWLDVGPTSTLTSYIKNSRATITFASSSSTTLFTMPANSIVTKILVKVNIAWNGTSPTFTLGTTGVNNLFCGVNDVDLKTTGLYIISLYELNASSTDMNFYVTQDGSTVGSASILVEYDLI